MNLKRLLQSAHICACRAGCCVQRERWLAALPLSLWKYFDVPQIHAFQHATQLRRVVALQSAGQGCRQMQRLQMNEGSRAECSIY
jgi:hypothetical protein